MGIAWEVDNVYWVMDGCGGHQASSEGLGDCHELGDIVRYDFMQDHGPGRHDHSDGVIDRYAVGVVKYVAGVPSHMKIDHETRQLFVADTGHARVLVIDIDAGERGEALPSREGSPEHNAWVDGDVRTLIEGHGLVHPSGLALHGEHILVTDNATSKIYAFDRDDALVDMLDLGLGPGSLMGIDVAGDGSLVGVDAVRNQVWRLAAE